VTAQFVQRFNDDDRWNDHMGWNGGWWMILWAAVMMAGMAALIIWLVRTTTHGDNRTKEDPLDGARRILAERYARGELTSDEYRERLDQLS